MAENLFHEARRYGAPATAKSLSALVSEPLDRTELALDKSIAAVFAAFSHDAREEEPLDRLHRLLTETTTDPDDLYALPEALSDRAHTARLVAKGDELVGLVFRGRLPSVADYVATASGVGRQNARGILTIAAPIACRVVGREVVSREADTSDLRQLLLAQRPSVQAVLGSWGTKLFFDDVVVVDDVRVKHVRPERTARVRLIPHGTPVGVPGASRVTWEQLPGTRQSRNRTRVWLWFELGALGLLGVLALVALRQERALGVARAAQPLLLASAAAVVSAEIPSPKPVTVAPDQDVEPPSSAEAPLGDDGGAQLPARFTVPGFEFGRASAAKGSEVQAAADRVAATLSRNPNTRVRIDGYTDDRGDADRNRDLSLGRAMSFRRWLGERGVDPGRVAITGRGAAQPLASNETDEGRAQNRRVEVVVTRR